MYYNSRNIGEELRLNKGHYWRWESDGATGENIGMIKVLGIRIEYQDIKALGRMYCGNGVKGQKIETDWVGFIVVIIRYGC